MNGSIWFVLVFVLVGCGQQANVSVPIAGDDFLNMAVDVTMNNNKLKMGLHLKNETNEELRLDFMSGQKYELLLVNEAGEEVYRFSENHMFTMALTHETINPKGYIGFEEVIDTGALEPGKYDFQVTLLVAAVNGEAVEDKAPYEKSVEVKIV